MKMVSQIPAASLVASPLYPNSVSWSEENLLAIASGHIISILNPALLSGPRGVITLPPNKPFPIGVVQKGDLLTACLLPICLSRETQPCARSISWSPLGLAPNTGSLLAVCTTEGRVKVYSFPDAKLCAEWMEVMDISDMLYDYFSRNNFHISSPKSNQKNGAFQKQTNKDPVQQGKNRESQPLITAKEYAYRSAFLSSLIVAWSPILCSSSGSGLAPTNCIRSNCAVLSVGCRSGYISFWRFHEPQSFINQEARVSSKAMFVGLLHAHSAWITAISWKTCAADASRSHLILATGSSDGSVKIWVGDVEALSRSSEINDTCFSLLKELISVNRAPVSSISMAAPKSFMDKIVLAVGKGSGSLEAWICHISSSKFENAGIYEAHDQVVTGLEWAFDGESLYSCSQDNSVRSWALRGSSLHESAFPSRTPMLNESRNAIQLSDPCFGLALSPGNLIFSVVHSLDSNILNPMYQARTQKAAVNFVWIGGRSLEFSSDKHVNNSTHAIPSGLTERDLMCWESDLLWSLMQFENVDKQLVLWDVLVVLLAFKQSTHNFVERTLCKWFSSWFLDFPSSLSTEKILLHILNSLPNISTRKLHLLNIIARRLMLTEVQSDRWNGLHLESDGINVNEIEKSVWENILAKSERELQERLVAFTLKAFLVRASNPTAVHSDNYSLHYGVAQMVQWVEINNLLVPDELKLLASKVREFRRHYSTSDYPVEESCSFCYSPVPFESPEVAFCKAGEGEGNSSKRQKLMQYSTMEGACHSNKSHKLIRCSTSMQLCHISSPLWFCICCKRSADRLAPETFFTIPESPLDIRYVNLSSNLMECLKPLCPYCGILLQRSQPDYFLSTSPV